MACNCNPREPATNCSCHDEAAKAHQLRFKKRERNGKGTDIRPLPGLSNADLYTSPSVKVYLYDPNDPEDAKLFPDPGLKVKKVQVAGSTIDLVQGRLRAGIDKPLILHRALLERASEFFSRQLKEMDARAAGKSESHPNTVTDEEDSSWESIYDQESERPTETTTTSQNQDAIYIPSRYIPSFPVFMAFIQFAQTDEDYDYLEGGDITRCLTPSETVFHLDVYRLARSLHAQALQQRSVTNLYDILNYWSEDTFTLSPECVLRLLETVYNLPEAPDGKEASYSLNLSSDDKEMDSAMELLLLYVVTRLSKFQHSTDMIAYCRRNKEFAGYIFQNAGCASKSMWDEPVFSSLCGKRPQRR
ncbi:hypothetical protein BJ508DRAFT_312963 [Ascobolus immersus RN42]|uniref:Uncharacterized protein n=1 Tax=Ascobolus immersus RN42 TaxID=1160509 RepID=A0A3N4HXB6_ASCIM|nr:hypothetical protein BJ508DRAFT_312963 [Ascobolus immersus RN42]